MLPSSRSKIGQKTSSKWLPEGIKDCSLAWAFSRFPFSILLATLSLGFFASWAGVSNHGFPEFQDPYLGFETRGTVVANRIIALRNLRSENMNLDLIENFPGERIGSRESRRRRGSHDTVHHHSYCSETPVPEYSRIAVEIRNGGNLEASNIIGRICYFQKMVEASDEYLFMCEKDGNTECCPMWSLPNYIARYVNVTDCMDVKAKDVRRFFQDLNECSKQNEKRSNSTRVGDDYSPCMENDDLFNALGYTLEADYRETNKSHYTMLILPVPKNPLMPIFLEDFQTFVRSIVLPDGEIRMAGFDFGTKDELFKALLISDLRYVIVSSVLIFVVVWIYTKSFFVTAISYISLTLTLGVSYFIYRSVICIPYFPFMNMLVTIIVLGIGIDGTLIISVAWRRCRRNLKDEVFNKDLKASIMKETLTETTPTLIITTCTTACAFFASLTSSVTTIRCFSVFAGTSIIVSFVLIYFAVPTSLLASDIMWDNFQELFLTPDESVFVAKLIAFKNRAAVCSSALHRWKIRARLTRIIEVLTVTRWAVGSFLFFLAGLVWALLAVFYSPGFQLPNTEQFQLLSSNHPMETFDQAVEPLFHGGLNDAGYDNLTFYFVWGVHGHDNGNYLDPNDDGVVEFDSKFSMSETESQKWVRKLCKKLRNQTFYDPEANLRDGARYDGCMLESAIEWMKRDCKDGFSGATNYEPCCKTSKFPYEPKVFEKCIGLAARGTYRTLTTLFKPDVAGFKFLTTKASDKPTKRNITVSKEMLSSDNSVESAYEGGELAAYVMRVKTTFSYSLSYEKMNTIFHEIDSFFENAKQSAPAGLKRGFVICSLLDFYDLQHSLLNDTWHSLLLSTGLCFLFILVSCRSLGVSIGAVASILTIVVVSSAILIQLFSWKLGVFEAIAVTVAVGLSDFTAHHSIEYAKRKSIIAMTSPTFYSAVATVTTGLAMMMFSDVLVYQQIGSFFVVLVLTSWVYSVFFLTPLLKLLDETETVLIKLTQRWISKITVCKYFYHCKPNFCACSWLKSSIFPCNRGDERKQDHAGNSNNITECAVIDGDEIQVVQKDIRDINLDGEKNPQMMETLKLLKKVAQETTV